MSHGREDSVKNTNVARNRRMSTDPSSQLEPRRVAKWRLSFCRRPHARGLRALWPRAMSTAQVRQINDEPQPITLQGSAYKSRPGLFLRQGPNQGAGLRQTCRAVGVSRDRQKLRRLLSCLPASKPDFRFVLSVPLSVESPFLSLESIADLTCRQPLLRSLASKHEQPLNRLQFSKLPNSTGT